MLLSSLPAQPDRGLQDALTTSDGSGSGSGAASSSAVAAAGAAVQGAGPAGSELPLVDETLLFFGRMDTFSGQEPEFTEVFRMSVSRNNVTDVCRAPGLRFTGASNCFVLSRTAEVGLPTRRDLYGSIAMSYTFYGRPRMPAWAEATSNQWAATTTPHTLTPWLRWRRGATN